MTRLVCSQYSQAPAYIVNLFVPVNKTEFGLKVVVTIGIIPSPKVLLYREM